MKKLTKLQKHMIVINVFRLYLENGYSNQDAYIMLLHNFKETIGHGIIGALILKYKRNNPQVDVNKILTK